jgi:hypothetical protein
MSFLKATWWRPATALAVLALAVLALSLSGSGTAHAGQDGSVVIVPAQKDISVGGQGDVHIDITAPDAGTSIWIVQVKYDPTVAQVKTNPGNLDHPIACDGMASPGQGIAQAASCDVKDTTADQIADTAVAFGGWVQNDGGTAKGFTGTQTAATFTFVAAPGAAAGVHTDLEVTVTSMLSPAGAVQQPSTTNGRIDIVESTGTSRIWGNVNCDANFNGGDAINVDRFLVSLPRTGNPPADCPAIDQTVSVNGGSFMFGDVNCNGSVTGGDAVNIDRALVSLPVTPTPPATCPVMGQSYVIS